MRQAPLPQKLSWEEAQTKWASQLNVLLKNPTLQSSVLKNVELVIGTNVINHKLGRVLQGWSLSRKRGPANIYDTQDSNQTPQLTLVLVSDAVVSIDLTVF